MKLFFKSALKFILKFAAVYTVFTVLVLLVFRFLNPAVSAFIQQKSGPEFPYLNSETGSVQKIVTLEKIAKPLQTAVIASEDQRFYEHWGFDFNQIDDAISEFREKNKLRGASTITQQLAKNLFLSPDKNILRKGAEAYFTIFTELLLQKERILELYLNYIEWGENLYGAEAASVHYFHKSASKLNDVEAAYLAALIPNPRRLSADRNSGYIKRRQKQILEQMKNIAPVVHDSLK